MNRDALDALVQARESDATWPPLAWSVEHAPDGDLDTAVRRAWTDATDSFAWMWSAWRTGQIEGCIAVVESAIIGVACAWNTGDPWNDSAVRSACTLGHATSAWRTWTAATLQLPNAHGAAHAIVDATLLLHIAVQEFVASEGIAWSVVSMRARGYARQSMTRLRAAARSHDPRGLDDVRLAALARARAACLCAPTLDEWRDNWI